MEDQRRRGGIPREVVRERERRAWELRQQCWTQERIAAELDLNQSSVCRILRRVRKRVLKELNEDIKARLADQLGQLDWIADEAAQSWLNSKKPAKGLQKKVSQDEDGKSEQSISHVEERNGDVRYLNAAMQALQDLRKLLGLEAPTETVLSGLVGIAQYEAPNLSQLSDEELKQMAALAERLGGDQEGAGAA